MELSPFRHILLLVIALRAMEVAGIGNAGDYAHQKSRRPGVLMTSEDISRPEAIRHLVEIGLKPKTK